MTRSKEEYRKIGPVSLRAIEECNELIHILCKIERFGRDNFHPDKPETTNRDELLVEVKDVEYICKELRKEFDL